MSHITVGKGHEKTKIPEPGKSELKKFGEDAVTAVGLCAVCLMLLIPVSRELPEVPGDAVAVMSTGVEELQEMDEPALYQPAEESIFDSIGRMFAGLLFGE